MNYDNERYYLFTQSYIASVLVERIRKKHGITKNQSSLEWLKRKAGEYLSLYDEKWKEILTSEFKQIPEVEKIANMFDFSESMLMLLVLYGKIPDELTSRCEIYTASEKFPIRHTGTYIRVDKTTSNKEILVKLREAKKQINLVHLDKVDLNEIKSGEKHVNRKRKDISKMDNSNKEIFIAVENKIKELILQKNEKGKEYDYKRQIVIPAIEQVVGDTMVEENWEDESTEEESRCVKLIKDVYYSMIERYRLPSYRDLKLILRVINS